MMKAKTTRKVMCVLIATVAVACTTVLLSGSRAAGYSSGDCWSSGWWSHEYYELIDLDTIRFEGGSANVDFGDAHWQGAPRGNAVICWDAVEQRDPAAVRPVVVQLVGRLYWDPHYGENGYANLAVSFSTDGANWGEKKWWGAGGNSGYDDTYIEEHWDDARTNDHIRLQLYRRVGTTLTRIYTFTRKLGDS